MLILRCTRKLLARFPKTHTIQAPACTTPPCMTRVSTANLSTTRLGDWYANLLNVGRHRLALCVNESTRLAIVLPAKELLASRSSLADHTERVLAAIGIPEDVARDEAAQMREVQLARTQSRSVLGTITDFEYMAEAFFETTDAPDLLGLALHLAQVPCSPLKYACPRDVARKVLGTAASAGAPPRHGM